MHAAGRGRLPKRQQLVARTPAAWTAARAGRGDDGFTIIEVMVAALVLIVGLLMVLAMYNGALRTTTTSNTRVADTNLAR